MFAVARLYVGRVGAPDLGAIFRLDAFAKPGLVCIGGLDAVGYRPGEYGARCGVVLGGENDRDAELPCEPPKDPELCIEPPPIEEPCMEPPPPACPPPPPCPPPPRCARAAAGASIAAQIKMVVAGRYRFICTTLPIYKTPMPPLKFRLLLQIVQRHH